MKRTVRAEPSVGIVDRNEKRPSRARPSARAHPRRRLDEGPVVLLVDDAPDQRDLYAQYLRFMGYPVEMASNGREAVEKANKLHPAVIVMDLSMPIMDGFEATRALKAHPDTRGIPVIALTGYATYLPEEWALSAGCAAYLSKPCLPAQLAEVIRQVLSEPPHAQ